MRTLITGLGEVVSGDIAAPLLDADSILIEDGRIAAVGRGIDEDADIVIDGKGATAFPGLIDSHVHPVFGDWTPRQRTSDFIESELHGGVTIDDLRRRGPPARAGPRTSSASRRSRSSRSGRSPTSARRA